MSGFRKPEISRDQMVLWEQRLDDAIPVNHPVRQFHYLLNSEAFGETFSSWEREYVLLEGKPPYHPRDLTGLYLYGMMNRIRSSRQLEAACYNRLDVIWLMQGQHPDHSTIAGFVKEHQKYLRRMFRDVLQVAIRAGLVKLDHVSIDGTKIEADAGKGSIHKESKISEELGKIDEQVEILEAQWAANEEREADLFGTGSPWIPRRSLSDRQQLAKLKRRQERLNRALSEIARRRSEVAPGSSSQPIASTTDPESRVMPDKEGKRKPNYNTQAGVDTGHGVIVAADASDAAEDSGQLTSMVDEVKSNCGTTPKEVSADSQYNTGPELAKLEDQGVVGYLPDTGTPSTTALDWLKIFG